MNSLHYTYDDLVDKRVVLLQSGGLDSNVCAAILSYWDLEIHHVFVDYGQNSVKKELENAERVAEHYGGKFYKCSISLPWLAEETDIVNGIVDDFKASGTLNAVTEGTYVPMRNAFLISIAASLADSLSTPYICAALDGAEDIDGNLLCGTTDKHPTFVKKFENALSEGSSLKWQYNRDFILLTPLMGMYKQDTIHLGVQYDADFSISWSCYNSGDMPCCRCSACRERAKGFYLAGVKDPVMQKYNLQIPVEDLGIED